MARRRRENPILLLLLFLLLAAGVLYILVLVWEIPTPSKTNVRCDIPREISGDVFSGQDVPDDLVCRP